MPAGPRTFVSLASKGENQLESNLTELNASQAVDKGFFTHTDWVAHVARYGHILKHITRLNTKGPVSILDVGCGRVPLAFYAWRNRISGTGVRYVGLDLRATDKWLTESDWSADMTLVRCDIVLDADTLADNWEVLDAPGFGPDEGFDIVICTEAFEHVPNASKRQLVDNLYRWTKVGGTAYLSTPNLGPSPTSADNHIGPDGIREWSYKDKQVLVQEAGFQIVKSLGTMIRLEHVPEEQTRSPLFQAAKDLMPPGWINVFAAAANPEMSNNAMFVMTRLKGDR